MASRCDPTRTPCARQFKYAKLCDARIEQRCRLQNYLNRVLRRPGVGGAKAQFVFVHGPWNPMGTHGLLDDLA